MTELEQLKIENERLYESRDHYKHEYSAMVVLANKWRIKAYVIEKLVRFLNRMNPWWYPEDLTKEIETNTNRLMEKWSRKEPWWKEEEELWQGCSTE